jgi:RNA polymerase sigma-70 factor (ECF subfamily)
MLNDLFIANRIKEGDIKVFENVFRDFYTPLYFYALSITGNTANAEDIVQDLFYTLWKDREKINIVHSLKSYLYKAVRNRALQFMDKQKTRKTHNDQIAISHTEGTDINPQSLLEYKELDLRLQNVMKKMPERRLHIFRLHRFEGKKYAEIADSLKLSIKTVEAEMTKTLKLFSKEIERYTT